MLPWTCGGEPPRIEGHTDGQIVTPYQTQQHVPSNRWQCYDKGCALPTFYSLLTSGSLIVWEPTFAITLVTSPPPFLKSHSHISGVLSLEDSSLFPVRCTNSSCSPSLSQLLPQPVVWYHCTFRVNSDDQILYSWCHRAKHSLLHEKYHLGTLPREASPRWDSRVS